MKLYHLPGACSTACHILLTELGQEPELIKVDLATKLLPDGSSYLAVNPKGQVPALVLDGEILTEAPVIMQYLADQAPQTGLLPPPGSFERYRVLEWLNYIATELHKTFSPLNRPNTPPQYRQVIQDMLLPRVFQVLDRQLADHAYLAVDRFTIVDPYAFVVLNWTKRQNMSLNEYPSIVRYMEQIAERPAVKKVLAS